MSEEERHEEPEDKERNEAARVLHAEELLAGAREVWIELHGVRYLLRVTRRGRLILTK